MSNKTENTYRGTSTLGLLGIVFVTLKLCGVIGWSWWWVTCPFWAIPAFLVAVVVVGCVLWCVVSIIEKFVEV